MLIPSIDLMGGRIVQLVQGATIKLAFDDFEYWIEPLPAYPIVQLIDLDAAMRQGDNATLIEQFARRLPCQVGGGIRTADHAHRLLDAGARRVFLARYSSAQPASTLRPLLPCLSPLAAINLSQALIQKPAASPCAGGRKT